MFDPWFRKEEITFSHDRRIDKARRGYQNGMYPTTTMKKWVIPSLKDKVAIYWLHYSCTGKAAGGSTQASGA